MKRNDYICLFLSIIINIGIVFALTVFSTDEMVKTDEIKIGLVAVESDASTRFKGEKNVDAKKQNLDADSIEKKAEEDKTQEEKPVEKPEDKPVEKPEKERPEKKVEENKKAEKTVQVEDKLKYDNVESKGITKAEIKDIQNDLQSGNKKVDIVNFKKDVNTISISKQIGKQAMLNGTMGVGIGMAANIGVNLITGKEVEAEEVIEAGIKTGASMGMATAVAGGIRVAVEKKVIPTVFSRMLTNNTIGAIAAASMDIIGTAFKLGSGEISLGKAVKDIGKSVGAAYGAIVASGWGYAGGMAIAGMIGLGTIGAVGTILGVGVAVVAGAVCATVGSKVAGAIANGIGTVAEAIVDGAVGIVKAGKEVVKSVASGVWNGVKAVCSGIS